MLLMTIGLVCIGLIIASILNSLENFGAVGLRIAVFLPRQRLSEWASLPSCG